MAKIFESLDLDALRKDERAFNALYEKLKRLFYLYALKISHDPTCAEDAVSDAFIYLYQARHRIDDIKHLRNYLYLAVRSKAFNCPKNDGPIQSIDPIELAEKTANIESPNDAAILESEFVYEELLDKVYSNLHLVSELGGRLIRLHYQQGLTISEIAEQLHLENKQVSNNLNKAITILRTALAGKERDKREAKIYFWLSLLWFVPIFFLFIFLFMEIFSKPPV